MKEYKCIKIEPTAEDTERILNALADKGYRVVCSYAYNNYYLILEREIKGGKK